MKLKLIVLLIPAVASAGVKVPLYTCNIGNVTESKVIEDCPYCFASWEENTISGLVEESSISRGCFDYNGPRDAAEECLSSQCLHVMLEGDEQDAERFCCCSGDGCNINFATIKELDLPNLQYRDVEVEEGSLKVPDNWLIYAGVCVSVILLVLGLITVVFLRQRGGKRNVQKPKAAESGAFFPVKLDQAIEIENFLELGSGTYGSSLCGASSGIDGSKRISVKVFNGWQEQAYVNEREVYDAIQMGSGGCRDAFLQFFGSKDHIRFTNGLIFHHSLILESCQLGFLDDFLRRNVVSWTVLCRMLTSIGNCLSLMHSGFKSRSASFAHRNLNSHNVLVRSDFSCSICNFEHATVLEDTTTRKPLGVQLSAAGAPRYMSPEVLEDPTSSVSLRQADVYSLGLLFWEVTRRCDDLYQGVPVPPFHLAFQNELGMGAEPTWDQMKILVSRRRARPLFPEVWKNSNPAIQQIRETIEDCWDHDAEARLTAFCIVERCKNMSSLMEKSTKRHVRGSCNNLRTLERKLLPISLESNILSGRAVKNDNVLSLQCPPIQIQPHQGRNPCEERNNMTRGPDMEAVVLRSLKDRTPRTSNAAETESRLVPSRVPRARAPRMARPIEYLQNDFGSAGVALGHQDDQKSKLRQFLFSKNSDDSKSSSAKASPKFNNVESDRERARLIIRSSNDDSSALF